MKLAFCLFKYFPYGGLQRDFLRIARLASQRGHDVHVYTTQWEGEQEPGLHLHIINVSGWQNHTRNRRFAEQVQHETTAAGFDLVIGFNKMPGLDLYYAADVCYQARVREQRGWLYRLLPRYRQQIANEAAVFSAGRGIPILLISPLQQPEFVHYYHTETERFHLLPPGIAKDRIAPANADEIRARVRLAQGLTDNDILLLMVGSGFKTKGLDRSLKALASLPTDLCKRSHLFVIGQDNPSPFRQLAQEYGIADKVHFLGGRPDVPDFLLAADLLLHPSYHENTGTVLLEALASGCPVLTVECCGYAHYVTQAKAGRVLSAPFQQSALNKALHELITSSELKQWGRQGLTFAKQTDIYSLPDKAVEIIENTLSFSQMMQLRGVCFRQQKGRLTQRITLQGQNYFIKQHSGVGWKEIFKNILQLRWPVLGAKPEWLAIKKLQSLGIAVPTPIAFASRGHNPATQQSYIVMEDLANAVSLEDVCKTWLETPPAFAFKRKLIEEVARIAATLHTHGINHRDFYLCHFLLETNPFKLSLIDLHRTQIRRVTPERWIIKDLAGLYFSSKEIGLTQRDKYRFMKVYKQESLREIWSKGKTFWQKVIIRGDDLYRDHTK